MITVYEYQNYLRPAEILQEYSCPHCCKALKWNKVVAMSPFSCTGCGEKLMDISKVINTIQLRVLYHFRGEKGAMCVFSGLM